MSKYMLIDASYSEEARVAVIDNDKLLDVEFDSALKQQIRGNIYLAKVTRVEPSLQAAFVEYGNEKQGFLSFSEIHPDYFRIPTEDKQALQEKVLAEIRQRSQQDDDDAEADIATAEQPVDTDDDEFSLDEIEQAQYIAKKRLRYKYSIQEVIKRGQVILVQVTKEERGNKGVALTTYISLAGRYCVFMPNSFTKNQVSISRKIKSRDDRTRISNIIAELDLPKGVSLIVRTAGEGRNKSELKRDYEYLIRLWSQMREQIINSDAPQLIYTEGDVVKKAIRDLYQRDTEKVIIQGEDAYKKARAVMKLLIPSHVKRIENYKDQIIPLFERYQVEEQIEAVFSPIVNLPSGGYLVINQTEALVAVDVNSGRANRDRDIDATALNTNLEAATEVARQLRLRDLAGLVVIDFIDMDDRKHRYKVEKALKDAVKNDRAKVQTGRISGFGLMEMSRQCIRSSVLEVALNPCPVCDKIGFVRSTHSGAVKVLRALERVGMKNQYSEVKIRIAGVEMLYLLNEKRKAIQHIEEVHHFHAIFERDDSLKVGEFEVIPTTKLTVAEKKQHHHESHDIAASLLDNGKGNGKKKPRPKKKKKPKAKSPTQAKANRGNQPSNKQSNQPTNEVTNKQSNEASNQPTPVAES